MKSAIFPVLVSVVTFSGLCTSADAASCGQGGGGPRPYPSNPYSSPYSSPYAGPLGPFTQNLAQQNLATQTVAAQVAPSAPQARLTVVPAVATSTSNLQIASPVKTDSEAKSTIREVPATETKAVDTTASATPTPASSKIDDSIKGLVGTWMAVSRQGNGELSTVELQLDDNGWAKLTIHGADGKPSTTTRKVEFENSELKLTGADADVMLGKLVEFNARQMVLERSGGQVTFVRP
jgi:hypothetical protein